MEFRQYIDFLKNRNLLVEINEEVSIYLDIARRIGKLDGKPVIFNNPKESKIPVVSNLFGSRSAFSLPFKLQESLANQSNGPLEFSFNDKPSPATSPDSFIFKLQKAIDGRVPPEVLKGSELAHCQEIVEKPEFIKELPLLKHFKNDGGRYITSGIVIYNCPVHGRNVSFHRLLMTEDGKLVARVVENRGLHTALKNSGGELEAAICIGNAPQIMIAASTSPPKGVDELEIANKISPFSIVKCKTINVQVPSNSEIIIEGKFTPEMRDEGPFLDLTGTLDIVRKQPSFKINCITHRKDPVYHALLPASQEHELLMGLPREATMLKELMKFPYFKDVRLTRGSAHWFNAVVQVQESNAFEPKKIIEACFKGHGSLKNCIIVDEDINIDDPLDVEYAITTRSQFNKDLFLFPGERGSSLDPSANQITRETCKVGIDATIPRDKEKGAFMKINK
ncbi:MAG: UbiD family decarboxylase [Promethearchaeota archaeon]